MGRRDAGYLERRDDGRDQTEDGRGQIFVGQEASLRTVVRTEPATIVGVVIVMMGSNVRDMAVHDRAILGSVHVFRGQHSQHRYRQRGEQRERAGWAGPAH